MITIEKNSNIQEPKSAVVVGLDMIIVFFGIINILTGLIITIITSKIRITRLRNPRKLFIIVIMLALLSIFLNPYNVVLGLAISAPALIGNILGIALGIHKQ